MSKSYRSYEPDQVMPPSLKDWLPSGHLAYFVSDVVESLDLGEITSVYEREERGYPPCHPVMMTSQTKVLVYGYCIGVASSRRIERACVEDAEEEKRLEAEIMPLPGGGGPGASGHRGGGGDAADQRRRSGGAHAGGRRREHGRPAREGQHGRGVLQRGHGRGDGGARRIPRGLSAAERMRRKLRTKRGREVYRRRKVRAEWSLICMGHNLLKLWRASATGPPMLTPAAA